MVKENKGLLSPNAQKIQDQIRKLGFSYKVAESPNPSKSAREAAAVVGCNLGQIAKSLIFEVLGDHTPVLIITSGKNRVDEEKFALQSGKRIRKASADFVYQKTGFAIGGIPPIGHRQKIQTFIDKDLLKYPEIWAAGGTPYATFKLTPKDLIKMTGGQLVSVC